jgi:hypothetical protein
MRRGYMGRPSANHIDPVPREQGRQKRAKPRVDVRDPSGRYRIVAQFPYHHIAFNIMY